MEAQNKDQILQNLKKKIEADMQHLDKLYQYLHQNPEISKQEKQSSERMIAELESLKISVYKGFGNYGFVGIVENGEGPVIMVRTDLDALPLEEKTNLPYKSTKKTIAEDGQETFCMHACGHDLHMTVFAGVASCMMATKDQWKGTLMLIGQPEEETGSGAETMLKNGLFEKFKKPDFCTAYHVLPALESGKIAFRHGKTMAGINTVDLTVYGKGGHGAYPDKTIDPIVLSARIIMDLQTIVSREISPFDEAVVTVGAIHGGIKHNIIPDEVKMKLTLRGYTDQVHKQILDAVKRICDGAAYSAGLPEDLYPKIELTESFVPPLINNEQLVNKMRSLAEANLGKENVVDAMPSMGGEDFSEYGRTADKIPLCFLWLGIASKEFLEECKNKGQEPYPLHSPYLAPDYQKAAFTGILNMSASLIEMFKNPLKY